MVPAAGAMRCSWSTNNLRAQKVPRSGHVTVWELTAIPHGSVTAYTTHLFSHSSSESCSLPRSRSWAAGRRCAPFRISPHSIYPAYTTEYSASPPQTWYVLISCSASRFSRLKPREQQKWQRQHPQKHKLLRTGRRKVGSVCTDCCVGAGSWMTFLQIDPICT